MVSIHLIPRIALFALIALSLTAAIYPYTRSAHVSAASASTINFQARLLTSSGAVVPDGDYNVEFKLYDTAAAGGTAQGVCSLNSSTDDCWWIESRTGANKVTTKNGYLTVALGDTTAGGTAFGANVPWDQELWLSFRVGGTGVPGWEAAEMTPRMKVTAVPYAFAAASAQSLKVTNGANSTTVSVTAPTAARTISFQDNSGVVPLGTTGNSLFFTTSGATNLTLPTSGTVTVNPASGYYLHQVPTSNTAGTNGANVIAPTTNSIVGLTVNGTTGTAANAFSVVQGGAATAVTISSSNTGSAQDITLANTAGTQTNGMLINRNGAGGTTTNLLNLTNTAGTATNGLVFTGTITNDVTSASGRALTVRTGNNGAGASGGTTISTGTGTTSTGVLNLTTGNASAGTAGNITIDVGTSTAGAPAINIGTAASTVARTIALGGTAQTGTITLGQSTAAQTVSILSTANTGAQIVNIANGATAANSTVSILSGVGTAGAGTLALGNNTRVTTIGIGNIAPAAARTTTIAGGNSAVVDTINIGTGNASVAGGKTINIGNGTPTGTNIISIGTSANVASTLTLQGGNGATAVSIQAAASGTINMGTTNNNNLNLNTAAVAGTTTIGGTTTTGTIVLGQSTATNTISIGNANTATANTQTINIGAGTPAGTGLTNINIGNLLNTGTVTVRSGSGNINLQNTVAIGTSGATTGTLRLFDANGQYTQLQPGDSAGNLLFTLPTTVGNVNECLKNNGTTAGVLTFGICGVASTLQDAYNASGTPAQITTTSNTKDFVLQAGVGFDSTGIFQIKNAAGTSLLTVDSATPSIALNANTVLTTGKTLTVTGDIFTNLPAGTEGQIYYDTTNKQLLIYMNGKWQADRTDAVLVAASNSSQADKSAADYVADGNTGAANDGDQVQINSALTAGAGKKVVLLAGTYTTDGSILVPNNTSLNGIGDGTLITQAVAIGFGNGVIENTDKTTGTGITIKNLKIDGASLAGNGIFFEYMGNATAGTERKGAVISVVSIINFTGDGGIALWSTDATTVTNSTFINNRYGIDYYLADNNIANDNTMLKSGDYGVRLWTATNNTISGNSMIGANSSGVYLRTSSSKNSITGNTFDNVGIGVNIDNGEYNTVSGNSALNNNQAGISVLSDNNIISSNTVANSGDASVNSGIAVWGNSNIVSSNIITDTSCTFTCYAIRIGAGSGNYLTDNRISGPSAQYPATINDAGTNTRYANQQTTANQILQSSSSLIIANASTIITGSIDPTASTSVIGVGTYFLSQLQVGDRITVNAETRTITAITTDTSLTVDTAFTDTANDTTIDRLPAALVVTNSIGANTVEVSDIGAVKFRNSTNTTTALQVQRASSESIFTAATAFTNNIVTGNTSFEVDTSGWVARANTTLTRTIAHRYYGAASLSIASTGANAGANFPIVLAANTKYTVSFAIKNTSQETNTLQFGYSADGTTEATYVSPATNINPDFQIKEYTFTTPATVNAGAYFFIKQTDAVSRTRYVDGFTVEVSTGCTSTLCSTGYKNSAIFLGSTDSFVGINNSNPGNMLSINTPNTNDASADVMIAMSSASKKGIVIQSNANGGLSGYHALQYQRENGSVMYGITAGDGRVASGIDPSDSLALGAQTTSFSPGTANNIVFYGSGSSNQTEALIRVGNRVSGSHVDVFTVAAEGAVTSKNRVDSTAAFQIQNAAGTTFVNADSTNQQLSLRNKTDSGVAGANIFGADNNTCTGTNWTDTGVNVWTHTTGSSAVLTCTSPAITASTTYEIIYTTAGTTASQTFMPSIGGVPGTAVYGNVSNQSQVITTTGTGSFTVTPSSSQTGTFTVVGIKPITNSTSAFAINRSNGAASLEVRTNSQMDNLAIGLFSLQSTYTISSEIATVGNYSLQSNTTGFRNSVLGFSGMQMNTTGYENVAVGSYALQNNISGYWNVAVGSEALRRNSSGAINIAIGRLALAENSTGSNNIALGSEALRYNINGGANIAIGTWVLRVNSSGYDNTIIGDNAALANSTGGDNSILGSEAFQSNTTGYGNTAVGSNTLKANTIGNNNTALGYFALDSLNSGSNNIGIGYTAGARSGSYNTAVGDYAGNWVTGSYNSVFGTNAGTDLDGSYNSFFGNNAGYQASQSQFRTFDGIQNASSFGSFSQVYQSNTLALGGQGADAVNIGIGTGLPTGTLSVEPFRYNTGTVATTSASGTVTGTGTTFTSAMVGSKIYIASSSNTVAPYAGTITGYASATSITVSPNVSFTSSGRNFYINYTGLQVKTDGDTQLGGNLLANGIATGTTGTTEATARTNVTTVTLTAAGSFANNDIIFIDNAGQDYYTRITAGGGTTTLTVTPAVSYDVSAPVTKYNIQNIGATTTDYTIQGNRFFQGYFLGGVVAGAGSTTYSDGMISASPGLTVKNPTDSTTAFRVQNTSGFSVLRVDTSTDKVTIRNDLSVTSSTGITRLTVVADNQENYLIGNHRITALTANGTCSSTHFGCYNVGFGPDVFSGLTSGYMNTAFGHLALGSVTTGSENMAIGQNALLYNLIGDNNVAIGTNSLKNTTGSNNVGNGSNSMFCNTTGFSNTALGRAAGASNRTGTNNVFIGEGAGYGPGYDSGCTLFSGGYSRNVAIGLDAGRILAANANNNILIGYQAGNAITTGASNILLGYDIDAQSATGSNQLSIGNILFGSGGFGTGTTVGNGGISVGTTTNYGRLTVSGATSLLGSTDNTKVITGSIDTTDTGAGPHTVTGVGTLFTSELQIGDRLLVSGVTRTVVAIASDTSLTVGQNFGDLANDITPERITPVLRVKNAAGTPTLIAESDTENVSVGVCGVNYTGQLRVCGTGDAGLVLGADSDNVNEDDNPFVYLLQDAGGVRGILGMVGLDGYSPNSSYELFGTKANSLFVGTETNSAIQFGTNGEAGGSVALTIDPTNGLILNPSFEGTNLAGPLSNWTAKAGTTLTRDTTQAYNGTASAKLVTTATANTGAKYTSGNGAKALATSTAYMFSFYAKLDGGSAAMASGDLYAAYARDGVTETNCTNMALDVLGTGAWYRYNCTITTDATAPAAGAYIIIKQVSATAHTFYIDAVQIETGGVRTYFNENKISFNGTVGLANNNPTSLLSVGVPETPILNATVAIQAQPDEVGLVIQAATQSGGAFQYRRYDGSILFHVTGGDGRVTSGNSAIGSIGGVGFSAQMTSYVPAGADYVVGHFSADQDQANDILQAGNRLGGYHNLFQITKSGDALFKTDNNSATAFRVQDYTGANVLSVDTSANSSANLITNPNFEVNTTGWAQKGTATLSRNTTQFSQGVASMRVITSAANSGAQFAYTLSANTTYSLRVHLKSAATYTTLAIGRQDVSGSDIDCLSGQTIISTEWKTFTCTFTTGGTITSSNIYIKDTTTGHTFYVDEVELRSITAGGSKISAGGTLNISGALSTGYVSDTRTVAAGATYTVSRPGTAYYLTANSTTTAASFTSTFNITGLPAVDGTVAVVKASSIKGVTAANQIHTVVVQINGTTLATLAPATQTTAVTVTRAFIVMRMNGVWTVVGQPATTAVANTTNSATTADFAEWIRYTGTKPEPGDILMVGDDPSSAKLSDGAYQRRQIGVVSTDPYMVAGAQDDNSVIIALTGRVPVKVSLENGPIQKGDLITSSSIPGVGMKAMRAGNVVGVALEDYDGTQADNKITVQLRIGYEVPEISTSTQLQGAGLDISGNAVLNGDVSIGGNLTIAGNLNISGLTTLTNLTVTGNAVFTGNLTVQNISVANITINGHIITAGNTPTATIGTAAGAADNQNNIPAPAVTITGNDTAGTITIVAGASTTNGVLAEVKFDKPFGGNPRAVFSAKNAQSAGLLVFNSTQGDKLQLNAVTAPTAGQTYTFDYIIVQ